jgi:hypothetical protein
MRNLFKKILYNIPTVKALKNELEGYKTEFPPGHYYSPITSEADLMNMQDIVFTRKISDIKGIDYNEAEQLNLLYKLQLFYNELPFKEYKEDNLRYYINNPFYYYSDGICLYSIMRHFKPARIVEVGSGFSSALMLDVNEIFFNEEIHFNFIDPYPDRLYSLLRKTDIEQYNIIAEKVQNVDMGIFKNLKENDILFIDSSHVSKIGSDVNFLLFDVLPNLKSGVLIHFHDIFYNFEYPKYWAVTKHWAWNENYLLRAFLQYNQQFKIILFNTFLENQHHEWFTKYMPLCIKKENSFHGSIWLLKK